MLTFLSINSACAFFSANGATILGAWVLFEQFLAANKKIKANSTFQLVSGIVRGLLAK